MKITSDDQGNKYVIAEPGDGFIYKGRGVRVIEVDEGIMDVKIRYADNGQTDWIREWELNDCPVLPNKTK